MSRAIRSISIAENDPAYVDELLALADLAKDDALRGELLTRLAT